MASNPTPKTTVTMYDFSSEIASFSANRPTPDDLSSGTPTVVSDFITALAPIVEFGLSDVKSIRANSNLKISNDKQGVGKREQTWVLHFQDATTLNAYQATIPIRDGSVDTDPGTDILPESVTALIRPSAEALFYSPDLNAGNLLYIQLQGRRS